MFDPPIDLSDLPGYQAAASTRPARVAFLGRCSTKDNQDPRSSIAGQLAEASTLLAPGEVFTAHFWDVESGMLGLDERSQGSADDYARLGVPVPRDGGLRELLEWAERGELDRVVCERIARVARDMLPSLQVEYHLASRGVTLECANEPRGGMTTGQLELRRTAQVRAEIYRHELLEQSMRGQRQHAAAEGEQPGDGAPSSCWPRGDTARVRGDVSQRIRWTGAAPSWSPWSRWRPRYRTAGRRRRKRLPCG
ncbi:recombinase family protein [Streptosporangium sandarakinum]